MKAVPFKIRVWDIQKKEMLFMKDIFSNGIYPQILFSEQIGYTRMRSVGFCDRKGIEIYQRDFVKIHSKSRSITTMVDWIPELAKFGWGVAVPGGVPHSFSIGNAEKMFEVVGNYFQDKDLI